MERMPFGKTGKRPPGEQVVVVFGASSGIGRATALAFAREGARVVVSARSQEALDLLVREIEAAGGTAAGWAAEATDFTQVQAVAQHAVNLYGRIDTWVHAAAVMIYATFDDTSPEEFRQLVDVNLNGAFYGAKAAMPFLREAGSGTLILISSVEGRSALPYHSAYAASKHGIMALADVLRMELAQRGETVDVVTILPAGINTPLYDKALTRLGVKPQPVQPIYTPELVARQILLAAAQGGREIVVGDGGKLLLSSRRLSLRLADAVIRRYAARGQRSDQPKSQNAPNNLYAHLPGYDTVDGPYAHKTIPLSVGDTLRSMPVLRWAVLAGMGAAAFALSRKKVGR